MKKYSLLITDTTLDDMNEIYDCIAKQLLIPEAAINRPVNIDSSSALFNHAVKFYGLAINPAAKVGNMGKAKSREMLFWTKEEYLKFSDVMMDKPISFYAFEMLYWCGIREGELLALTPVDFDFERKTVSITKSYQRIKGRDVITTPKTQKSNRVINMPQFLCDEMQEFIEMIYGIEATDRIFPVTMYYLHHEMDRGTKEAKIKRIRVYDIRHSHISLCRRRKV